MVSMSKTHTGFGMTDKAGREIGYAMSAPVFISPIGKWVIEHGTTRAGKAFGGEWITWGKTEAEVVMVVTRKREASRARYAKEYGVNGWRTANAKR